VRRHRGSTLLLSAALLVGVAQLAGCAAPLSLDAPAVAELPAPVPEWITVRVSEADDGRRIELARAGSMAVALRVPSGAGTGWIVVGQPSGLALTGRFTGPVWPPGAPASATVPAPIWQVFVFEALAPGEGTLRFELRGNEALGSSRARSLTLRVTVPPG
jgi:hypothetical protein